MKGGPGDGAGARSRAQLEERAASEDTTRTLNERKLRVARRRAVVDREHQDRALEARLNAWQQSMECKEESEAQEEGEAERHRRLPRKPVAAALRDIPPAMRTRAPLLAIYIESAKMHYMRLKKRKRSGGADSTRMRLMLRWAGRPLL